ncbi:bifunctional diguanylate cyclase/phosphodiesterase [Rhizobium rhizogenes]|uniref:GGDEF-domain containing protein n=1 Tax=Rhizobium rhizogenes TaxID=359 RepID=A0AA92HAV5_RHIRH|nr:EAL domain-containing protein [Rhizobium rhizogenes]PVE56871.1 GGDEF-domain containing protein [Rhizobium rhizogenes]PVE68618.1 GGDEF-domain containing protein [Agrobacterium tumefaciens]PVE78366.1 GGDEF-domain containing protein [Sphingomonas sp. TPD3009]
MPSMHPNRAKWEAIVWLLAFALIYGTAFFFDGHEAIDALFVSQETYNLDEIFTALTIAGGLGLIYSVLRIKDMHREIQLRVTAEKHVDWIACHDPLTELPNRRLLEVALLKLLTLSHTQRSAIFSLDLDGFKKVNDLLGHEHGDQVLKVVAKRLCSMFPEDNVYRLGGDEFVVVVERKGNQDLSALGKRMVIAISKPIAINGATVEIGASIGFARIPEDSAFPAEAIQYSDCAMYAAKKIGRNIVKAFVPEMQEELIKKIQMEADLKLAMKLGKIRPHYQPLVDLKTQEIVGYEALARWEREPGKFVSPCEFIPLAENAGLIVELTDQLFRIACQDALSWPPHTVLSFNISPVQLSDRLLGLRLLKVLGEVGLPVHRLELEVTESALINDADTARDVLDGLVKSGIKIALDDFGTGYSSLSQLSNYQFNKIKIDRKFVATFEESDRQEKVVRAIIALGIGLGVKITAEGIEDASQLRRLQDLGCDIGQGYLLGKPRPIEETLVVSERQIA